MNAYLREWTEEEYEDFLNDIYPEIKIGELVYSAGRVLKEVDPTAFRCGMSEMPEEWICEECESIYDTEEEAEECCYEEEE